MTEPKPIRRWKVRVTAEGYAIVTGATKKEAVQHARDAEWLSTQRPNWHAQVSDIKELE